MSKRVRVIQYVIHPVLVVDDGADLTPLDVEPITVPAAGWASFIEGGLASALAGLEAQVNDATADGPEV